MDLSVRKVTILAVTAELLYELQCLAQEFTKECVATQAFVGMSSWYLALLFFPLCSAVAEH